jgi:hypothetical protein
MLAWLDKIPLSLLLAGAILIGGAPFVPEPHLIEKSRMLIEGDLARPIDILDLLLHGAIPILLLLKLFRMWRPGRSG